MLATSVREVVVGVIILAAYFALLAWVKRDAESRGVSGLAIMLVIFFFNILGLLIWFVLRPAKTNHD
jgi:amino acid permease